MDRIKLLDRRTLPLTALRSFEAAGRCSNLRQAAKELGVTHAAISRQIKSLENQFEVKLFFRTGRGMQLTAAGTRLLKSVTEGLDTLIKGALYLDTKSLQTTLHYGSTASATSTWLSDIVWKFCSEYEEVNTQLHLIEPQQKQLPTDLDLAICYGKPSAENWHINKLHRECFYPVASPALISSLGSKQTNKKWWQLPLLHDKLDRWPSWFEQRKIDYPKQNKQHRLVYAYQAIQAAEQDQGIVLADGLEIRQQLATGKLVKLDDFGLLDEESIYLATPSIEKLPLLSQAFVNFLQQQLTKLN